MWAIMSRHSSFGKKQIRISLRVHRQVMNHNAWYIFIGKQIVCNSEPLFYHCVVPLCLGNMIFWVFIIHLYSHLIAHFIHDLFKLVVAFNVFNGKYYIFVMSHYYIQSPVAILICSISKWV